MFFCNLEIAQMLKEHPVLNAKLSYRLQYVEVLEYFVRKFSEHDEWANATLELYKRKMLDSDSQHLYSGGDNYKRIKSVVSTKFKHFSFFLYRYSLIMDCIFINAIKDIEKGKKIYMELSTLYHKRYHRSTERFFNALYRSGVTIEDYKLVRYMAECWKKNMEFIRGKPLKVLITANMSAGKSTLINALVGKKVNKTQNDACTAKIHYIVNKAFEDGFCYESDYMLNLDADYGTLMEDNHHNEGKYIIVGTFFRTFGNNSKRIRLTDTPGVNSPQNIAHKELTEKAIVDSNADLLIYVLNGENIGTDDDRKHLLYILENYYGKIIFVINKLDRFRKKEDSVSGTIDAVIRDLSEIGFVNPKVFPISAYAAYLAKAKIFKESLDEDEEEEFARMSRKMNKEEYQFNTYYPKEIQAGIRVMNDENYRLLMHSGIIQLERIIYGRKAGKI